jgi:hypothetical protein
MNKSFFRQAALFLLAVGGAAAYPYTVNLTGYDDFVGGFSIGPGVGLVYGYGGGFGGSITNNTTNQTSIATMFCDDFANDVVLGNSYAVNVTPIPLTGTLANTRFGGFGPSGFTPVEDNLPAGSPALNPGVAAKIDDATALQRYQMAAFLISNYSFFDTLPAQSTAYFSDSQDLGIQTAIWAILDPSNSPDLAPSNLNNHPVNNSGDIVSWLNAAAAFVPTQQFLNSFAIVSDVNIVNGQGGIQEFIAAAPVPEPSFYLVLAAGLAVVFWAARRKRQAA